MPNFIAVLDRWLLKDSEFKARFTEGSGEAQVIYVTVEGLQNPAEVENYFGSIEPFNDEVVVSPGTVTEVSVQHEHGDPLLLRGTRVTVRTTTLEAADFERRAQLNEEWSTSTHTLLTQANIRIDSVRHLLQDQRRRLVEKVERHAASDSTARLLYEQQISFIDRVLSKLDT
jgi:hypothetical protein